MKKGAHKARTIVRVTSTKTCCCMYILYMAWTHYYHYTILPLFLLVPSLTDLAPVLLDPPLLHRAPLTVTETSVVTEGCQSRLTQLSRHQLTVPPVQQIEGSIVSNTHISILSNTHIPILSNTHAPIPRQAVNDSRLRLERRADERNHILSNLLGFLRNHNIVQISTIETLGKPVGNRLVRALLV